MLGRAGVRLSDSELELLLASWTTLTLRGGIEERVRWLPWDQMTPDQTARACSAVVRDLHGRLRELAAGTRLRLILNDFPPALEEQLRLLQQDDPRLAWDRFAADDDDAVALPPALTTPGERPRCIVGRLDELPLAAAWADWLAIDPRVRDRLCYVYSSRQDHAAAAFDAAPMHPPPELAADIARAELISTWIWAEQAQYRYWDVLHAGEEDADDFVDFGFHDNLGADEARALLAEGFDLVEARDLLALDVRPAQRAQIWAGAAAGGEVLVLDDSVFDLHALVIAALGDAATFELAFALAAANADHPSSALWFVRELSERPDRVIAALLDSERSEQQIGDLVQGLSPYLASLRDRPVHRRLIDLALSIDGS